MNHSLGVRRGFGIMSDHDHRNARRSRATDHSGFNHSRGNWPIGFHRHDGIGEMASVNDRQFLLSDELAPPHFIDDLNRFAGGKRGSVELKLGERFAPGDDSIVI